MSTVKLKHPYSNVEVEGKVIPRVLLRFEPVMPPDDKQRTEIGRINARLQIVAKNAEQELEDKINQQLANGGSL